MPQQNATLKQLKQKINEVRRKGQGKNVSAKGIYYHSDVDGTFDIPDLFDAVRLLIEIIALLLDYIEHIKMTIPKCVMEAIKETNKIDNFTNISGFRSTLTRHDNV
jgi:hypothetical protein